MSLHRQKSYTKKMNVSRRNQMDHIKIIKSHEVFELLKPYLPQAPVILEAGSFNGGDTLRLHTTWPQATIHAFEPVPEIFTLLKQNTEDIPQIHCHNVALSNHNGFAQFHVSEHPKKRGKPFQAGSLLKPKERLALSPAEYTHTITVPTITLDAWAEQNNVDRFDFLWLDMQGHELDVLKSAPKILRSVRAIWTEVEFIESYEKVPQFPEVTQWLETQGFKIVAKDFTNETDWFFGNALYVRG